MDHARHMSPLLVHALIVWTGPGSNPGRDKKNKDLFPTQGRIRAGMHSNIPATLLDNQKHICIK